MPMFSVIIPTYNRSDLLAEAIDSALAQEWTDYELIVVDDGSTDETPAVISRYADRHPATLRVIRQANAGQGAARNRAIAEARGEYCVFLDSDDLLFPWTLATLAEAIAGNHRPGLLITRENHFRTGQAPPATRQPLRVSTWRDFYAYAVANRLGAAGTIVARRELLQQAGGFLIERVVGEDADLMLRLGTVENVVKIEAPAMHGYRMHSGNFTRDPARWHRGACELIRRYRQGIFPGGTARTAEVRKLVAREAGLFSLMCLAYGSRLACADLYCKTIIWQLKGRNYFFIYRPPLLIAAHLLGLWPRYRMRAFLSGSSPGK